MNDPLEDELRAAFAAAAGDVQPAPHRPTATRAVVPAGAGGRRRWALPLLAAAAAAAVVVPLAIWAGGNAGGDSQAARQGPAPAGLEFSGDTASVAGVRFPVPATWTAAVTGQGEGAKSVVVCVAAAPGSDCADGVSMTIAVADAAGAFQPVPDPGVGGCEWIQLLDVAQQLGGRSAIATSIGCTADGPRSLSWYMADGSLSVVAASDALADQADQIVAGLDLSAWSVKGGTPIATVSSSASR